MEKEQVVSYLTDMFGGKTWFDHVSFDEYNRVVMYVHQMDSSVVNLIPEFTEDRRRIMVHFASSVKTDENDVVNRPQHSQLIPYSPYDRSEIHLVSQEDTKYLSGTPAPLKIDIPISILTPEEEERELERRVKRLTDELDRLEKICGTNILGDIFFEENDGKNAVTNLSSRFPEVRKKMHELYIDYGFDILYEQLEL